MYQKHVVVGSSELIFNTWGSLTCTISKCTSDCGTFLWMDHGYALLNLRLITMAKYTHGSKRWHQQATRLKLSNQLTKQYKYTKCYF